MKPEDVQKLKETISLWKGLGWSPETHPVLAAAEAELKKWTELLDVVVIAESFYGGKSEQASLSCIEKNGHAIVVIREGSGDAVLRTLQLDSHNALALSAQLAHAVRSR